jgi:hypothetical protein
VPKELMTTVATIAMKLRMKMKTSAQIAVAHRRSPMDFSVAMQLSLSRR